MTLTASCTLKSNKVICTLLHSHRTPITDYQAPQSQGEGEPSALEEGGCYTKALALGSPLWHLCNTNPLAIRCRSHLLADVLSTIAELQFGHLER